MINNLKEYPYSKILEYTKTLGIEQIDDEILQNLKSDSRKNVIELGNKLERKREKHYNEVARVLDMYNFDKNFENVALLAGVDEVGRGPLAGPIVAAAVILKYDDLESNLIEGINDSKKLSEKKRIELDSIIKEKAIAYNITVISNREIDDKGIAWCNNEVLKRAVQNLRIKPDFVISDGYTVKGLEIDNEYFHKGDSKSAAIACASIIAKVFRDSLMKEYHETFKKYNFAKNVGYGSEEHINAIKKYGITEIHRKSFLKNIL